MNAAPLLLRSLEARRLRAWPDAFPYNVPVLRSLDTLEFTAPVTFLVGENGSGKSTLLEAIACAAALPTAGSEGVERDQTLAAVRRLARDLRLSWSKRTRRGFFMRAEDFFGYVKQMETTRQQLRDEMAAVDEEYAGRSAYAKGLAKGPYARELADMQQRYGDGLDTRSHGESYLDFFQARFVPDGLYLLDEPEAPLSPKRQLSFLVMLKGMVAQGAQFIIVTHSPIIMGFPGAAILSCDGGTIRPVAYADVEHVYVTKTFLNNPDAFLKHLLE